MQAEIQALIAGEVVEERRTEGSNTGFHMEMASYQFLMEKQEE